MRFLHLYFDKTNQKNESDKWYSYPVLASFILFFLLPLIVIIILYILILRGVRRSVKFTQPLHPIEKPRKHSGPVIKRGRSISFQTGQDKRAARQHQELSQIQQAHHQARLRTNKALIRILGILDL
ncbi:hypothetical protein ACTXT7_013870 [Hymenolepis weldensis]